MCPASTCAGMATPCCWHHAASFALPASRKFWSCVRQVSCSYQYVCAAEWFRGQAASCFPNPPRRAWKNSATQSIHHHDLRGAADLLSKNRTHAPAAHAAPYAPTTPTAAAAAAAPAKGRCKLLDVPESCHSNWRKHLCPSTPPFRPTLWALQTAVLNHLGIRVRESIPRNRPGRTRRGVRRGQPFSGLERKARA